MELNVIIVVVLYLFCLFMVSDFTRLCSLFHWQERKDSPHSERVSRLELCEDRLVQPSCDDHHSSDSEGRWLRRSLLYFICNVFYCFRGKKQIAGGALKKGPEAFSASRSLNCSNPTSQTQQGVSCFTLCCIWIIFCNIF